jgi:hypothetical protein
MDFIPTSPRSDTLSAVGSIIVPGAVASLPYVGLLWGPPHNLKGFVDANQGVATAAAGLIIVAVGLLVESAGSYVEYYAIDETHDDPAGMRARWWKYLQIAWGTAEPIGQHYLRRILAIFKFELNLSVAAFVTLPGTAFLGYFSVLPPHGMWAVIGFTLALAVLLFVAALHSSRLLDQVRERLLEQARGTTNALRG